MINEEQKRILIEGAKIGTLPSNVPCPVGCRFCYECHLEKIFPNIKSEFIPKYEKESFDFFKKESERNKKPMKPGFFLAVKDGKIYSRNFCDFFSLGLDRGQIEDVIQNNKRYGIKRSFYTTGLNVDPDLILYLTNKYKEDFRLWISLMTFDDELKKKLVQNWTSSDDIKKIIKSSYNPQIMLFYISYNQVINDLRIINDINIGECEIAISQLHYNKFHPEWIKNLVMSNIGDFSKFVFYLSAHPKEFGNIYDRLCFISPSGAFAWKFREDLKDLLKGYFLDGKDLILCSHSAYKVLRSICGGDVKIEAVSDIYCGSNDFTTPITSKEIFSAIQDYLKKDDSIKRVFVPSTMWAIEDKFDMNCMTIDSVRKEFPSLEIIKVMIPPKMLKSNLSLKDCIEYYNFLDKDNIVLGRTR